MFENHISANFPTDALSEAHLVGKNTQEWVVTPLMSPPLRECGIFLTGWSVAQEGFNFVRPRFPLGQALVCTEGTGEVWMNGAWTECRPGMAYLTPPHVFHAYRARSGEEWKVCWVTYYTQTIDGKQPLLLQADPSPLSAAIRHLYDEATSFADRQTLTHWTQLVNTSVLRIAGAVACDLRLSRLWKRVREQPARSWNGAGLAAEIGVSSEHLRRLCQKEHGCGPMDHVTQIRMQYAIALLAAGVYTVAAIAERIGYSSPYAFSAAFKRIHGISPSQYVAVKLPPQPK